MRREGANEKFWLSLWGCLLACPVLSFSLYVVYIWSLCHLELTRLQSATGSHDTTTTPPLFFYISLTQPLSEFFLSCNTRYSLSPSLLSPPPALVALFLSFSPSSCSPLSSPLNCSLIRFGKPLASPFFPFRSLYPSLHSWAPTWAWSKKRRRQNATELSHVQHKQKHTKTLGSYTREDVQYLTHWGLTPQQPTAHWKLTKRSMIKV